MSSIMTCVLRRLREVSWFEVLDTQVITAVPTVKSNPAILMVQSAQDRATDDIPGPLNAARDRGILVQ
jgi:hypothetical protein